MMWSKNTPGGQLRQLCRSFDDPAYDKLRGEKQQAAVDVLARRLGLPEHHVADMLAGEVSRLARSSSSMLSALRHSLTQMQHQEPARHSAKNVAAFQRCLNVLDQAEQLKARRLSNPVLPPDYATDAEIAADAYRDALTYLSAAKARDQHMTRSRSAPVPLPPAAGKKPGQRLQQAASSPLPASDSHAKRLPLPPKVPNR